jgi:hypothetical protein
MSRRTLHWLVYGLNYVLIHTGVAAIFGQRRDNCPSARNDVENDRDEKRRGVAGNAALDQRFPQPRLGKLRISCSATELPRHFADLRGARG